MNTLTETRHSYTGELDIIECAACHMDFGVLPFFERARRDDHETFYCPNGHSAEHRCGACGGRGYFVSPIETALAKAEVERDALQARLDAMTVEWALLYGPDEVVIGPYPEKPWHGPEYTLSSRLVGPWTVVPEGDKNV